MKPGPHPWATNDSFASGSDIGSDTKTAPPTLRQEDGYRRTDRPGPDILNWQLNRGDLVYRSLARLQAMNWILLDTDTTDYQGGNLLSSCHGTRAAGQMEVFFFFHDASVGTINELSITNRRLFSTPASDPCTAGGFAPPTVDADHDNSSRRIIVVNDGAVADTVRYAASTAGGSWTTVTFTAGAPSLLWNAVGCDRDTAGGANELWLIGDDAGGGNPAVWSSSDGVNFAVVGTFPSATLGEAINGIFHTCHPAGALGPDDAGNPSWLILSDTYATSSADGSAFTATAHGLALGGGSFNAKSAAYSRISRRWVVALPAASAGDIAYSDDNGATWTTVPGVLDTGTSDEPIIAGDGYGTFVVTYLTGGSEQAKCFISTDEGLTWSIVGLPSSHLAAVSSLDGTALEGAFDESKDIDETSLSGTGFYHAVYDDSTPDTEICRSLVV